MNILGISAFYHDSASCLLRDGKILAAAQEERFTRKKHDSRFPIRAIQYCMQEAGLQSPRDIDHIGFYEWPQLRFERILTMFLRNAPAGYEAFKKVIPLWCRQKLWVGRTIREQLGYEGPIDFIEHHRSHAASAFFASPFPEAAILTLDGVGEWSTATWGTGIGNTINIDEEMKYPDSLGLLYSAFTYYLGFKVNSGEYKVMGLAPYGEPRFVDTIFAHLVDLKDDGSFRLNMKYFDYEVGLAMTNPSFEELFQSPRRVAEAPLTRHHMDVARSLQEVTNRIVLQMANYVGKRTGQKKLCMAGGVALNCVANGFVLDNGPFNELWIQPAAGDAGAAAGVAMNIWFHHLGRERHANGRDDLMQAALLGPAYSDDNIRQFLEDFRIPHVRLTRDETARQTAQLIASGAVVGWFQGRMEFGPRALGSRSILGDARSTEMQAMMNLKIKFRESFRPFAPSVLEERAGEYFEMKSNSPYMMLTFPVAPAHRLASIDKDQQLVGIDKLRAVRSDVPAITHVDYSARVQTVSRKDNELYYDMIKAFYELTGCPTIINTSLNVRGEPICATPEDAFRCFMRTNMDFLVMGSFLLDKKKQGSIGQDSESIHAFELD